MKEDISFPHKQHWIDAGPGSHKKLASIAKEYTDKGFRVTVHKNAGHRAEGYHIIAQHAVNVFKTPEQQAQDEPDNVAAFRKFANLPQETVHGLISNIVEGQSVKSIARTLLNGELIQ